MTNRPTTLIFETYSCLAELSDLIDELQNKADTANSYTTGEIYRTQLDVLHRVKAVLLEHCSVRKRQ